MPTLYHTTPAEVGILHVAEVGGTVYFFRVPKRLLHSLLGTFDALSTAVNQFSAEEVGWCTKLIQGKENLWRPR